MRSLVRDGTDPGVLKEAADLYRRRMNREGREDTKIKHASTFFGPDDWWREELENGSDQGRGGYDEGTSLVPGLEDDRE